MKQITKSFEGKMGFTLIEMLIVVAIMAILAVTVVTALKPAQRLSDARDARRAQDINQISTAIGECVIDKKDGVAMATCLGTYAVGNTYEIVTTGTTTACNAVCSGATSATSCLPLDTTLGDYFTSLPQDPKTPAAGHTSYSLKVYANNMVVVEACGAEVGTIKVSR